MAYKKKEIQSLRKSIRQQLEEENAYIIRVAQLSMDFAKLLAASIEELESESDPIKNSILRNLVAEIYFLTSEIEQAKATAQEVKDNSELPPQVRAYATAIIAQVHVDKSEFARGEELCKEALALTENGDDLLLSKVLNVIGSLHFGQARYSLALEYSRLRKRVAERLGDNGILISVINNMALSYTNLGRDDEAAKCLEHAKSLARDSEATIALAHVMSTLAGLYLDNGETEKGLQEAETALALAKDAAYARMFPTFHIQISNAHFRLGNFDLAEEHGREAVRIAEERNLKEALAGAHGNMAKILAEKKDAGAAKHFQRSIELFSSHDQPDYANNLGFVYLEYGNYLAKNNDPMSYEYLGRAKSILSKLPPNRKTQNALSRLKELEKNLYDEALIAADSKVKSLEWELDSLKKILDISREINSEIELESILGVIVDSAMRISGAERGFTVLLEGKARKFAAVKNFMSEITEHSDFPSISKIIDKAIEHPSFADNLGETDGVGVKRDLPGGIKSVRVFPLRTGAKMVGLVYLDSRYAPISMDATEKGILEAVLDQATLIIERMQSFVHLDKEIKKKNEELEQTKSALERKQKELEARFSENNIIGTSASMQKVFSMLDRIREAVLPVFISGESGTGKELIAKAIHYNSDRKKKHFIAINCAAIPENLLESELFGYEKGAFTGADKAKEGLFEVASGGSLFLDEIGDMSSSMQQKILRVVQENEVRRIGASKAINIDIRLISASNKDLKKLVKSGQFREDLYYRVSVLSITIPSLRDRMDDIPILVEHFWKNSTGKPLDAPPEEKQALFDALKAYDWPGNVRELENEIRRLASLGGGSINSRYLSKHIIEKPEPARENGGLVQAWKGQNLTDFMGKIEKDIIITALKKSGGRKSEAARLLGIPRSTLCSKIEKHGIVLEVNAK